MAPVPADTTSYASSKIAKPNWNFYRYRVKACNENGLPQSSNEVRHGVVPSGKLYGYARATNGDVHANVVVALKPKAYAYGTKDYFTNTDNTGYFEFNNVLRRVYSSGGNIFWVKYNLYINEDLASPEFTLRDPFILRQDALADIW